MSFVSLYIEGRERGVRNDVYERVRERLHYTNLSTITILVNKTVIIIVTVIFLKVTLDNDSKLVIHF